MIENVDFGTLDSVYKIPEFTVSLYCENAMLLSTSSYGRNLPPLSRNLRCRSSVRWKRSRLWVIKKYRKVF